MVCSSAVRAPLLCCSGHLLHQSVSRGSSLASTSCPHAFAGVLTGQGPDLRRWQPGQGALLCGGAVQPGPAGVQRSVRAEAGAGAAGMPPEGSGASPLQAVASPGGAAPAVEAGRAAGKRGRGGARSKEKRRLVLLRHAKSSFADPSLRDHERPLDEAGRESARAVAAKLKSAGWLPKLVLCSDSLRTRETLAVMQSVVGELAEAETRFLGSYYTKSQLDGQTAQHLRETICSYAADAFATVMCMGHNRGWEEAASDFTGLQLELKTANAALLETTGDSWEDAFEHAYKGGWKLCGLLTPDPAG